MRKLAAALCWTLVLAMVAIVLAGNNGLRHALVVRATEDPCSAVTDDPNPPSSPLEPAIGGTVITAGVNPGVSGATVRLYICDGTTAEAFDTQSTASNGTFSFSGLTTTKWYFIQVDESGPLSGMTAASGTSNPTDLIEVGEGTTGLVLAFE